MVKFGKKPFTFFMVYRIFFIAGLVFYNRFKFCSDINFVT